MSFLVEWRERSPNTVSIKPTVYEPSRKYIISLTVGVGGLCGGDLRIKCTLLFFPFTEWEPESLAFLRIEAKSTGPL